MNRLPACFLSLAAVSMGWAAEPAASLPESTPVQQYEAMWKKSPFTLSSAPTESAGLAASFGLAGFARIGEQDFVTVVDKQSQERIMVGPDVGPSGLSLVSVKSDPDPTKSSVVIRRGEDTAEIKFDASALQASQIVSQPTGLPMAPGSQPNVNNRPPGAPGSPPRVFRRRGPIIPGQPPAAPAR